MQLFDRASPHANLLRWCITACALPELAVRAAAHGALATPAATERWLQRPRRQNVRREFEGGEYRYTAIANMFHTQSVRSATRWQHVVHTRQRGSAGPRRGNGRHCPSSATATTAVDVPCRRRRRRCMSLHRYPLG